MLHDAMKDIERLSYTKILTFWAPLAITWMMMACEGPFLAAVVARLAESKINLAAHGVAIHIAILIEAPVIMIMSASTALAKDRTAYYKLRNFTFFMNLAITLVLAVLLITPAMDYILRNWMNLPENVASLVFTALIILLPWPGAIGYRRFYQGILIRSGKTRLVAYGTVIRLVTMFSCGLVLYFLDNVPGALLSAISLSSGVVMEAIAARIMAIKAVKSLVKVKETEGDHLTYRQIINFYYPLALTCTIGLAVHPMVVFFVGKSLMPLESLAVIPVVNSLAFFFIALGISYTEAAIANLGVHNENYRELRNFAIMLAIFISGCLALIAFTPISWFWFNWLSGMSEEVSNFAALPAMIMAPLPGLTAILCFQRAVMVKTRKTAHVTWATVVEICGVIGTLFATIHYIKMIGAVAAAIGLNVGRIAAILYLLLPCKNQRTL